MLAESSSKSIAYNKERTQQLRLEALNAYGGPICKCCGETILTFLTIDHINGGGNKERKERSKRSSAYWYYWLKRNNYPIGFQVLCFNCNIGRSINGGICPHQNQSIAPDVEYVAET